MPRPQNSRKICSEPKFRCFSPTNGENCDKVELFTDEYEVIRLVDLLGKTHAEAAELMQVSRTTVTDIYESARRKVADAIINGKRLEIGGGCYRVCGASDIDWCGRDDCPKRRRRALERG